MITFPTLPDSRLTSPFGWRTHPVTGVRSFHHGIDLAPAIPGTTGVPVFAAQDGIVVRRQFHTSMGNYIMIEHTADDYTTHYLHLASYSVPLGAAVNAGDQIGVMGTTGGSTGIHLDFGVSTSFPTVFGSPGSYVDPVPYLEGSMPPDIPTDPDDPDNPYYEYSLLARRKLPLRYIRHRRRY